MLFWKNKSKLALMSREHVVGVKGTVSLVEVTFIL